MVENKDIKEKLKEAASKYDNLELTSSSYDEENGKLQMVVSLKGGSPIGEFPSGVEVVSQSSGDTIGTMESLNRTSSSMRRLEIDPLSRNDLDLAKPSVLSDSPQRIYERSIDYYRTKDVYGSTINILTNFASKGFENDIDDETIKNFYDNWVIDTGFDDIVEKIFFDLFRVGLVRTYKILGKFEPKVNYLSSIPGQKPKKAKKDTAAARNRYSKSFIPIGYTILNPVMVVIKGSLMFGQTSTYLKKDAGKDIKAILDLPVASLSDFDKKILKHLPADFKRAIKDGEDIPLDPNLIGEVDYRRMPYERYPLPRGSRAFEALEFKDELRKADYSTLDGITNYILKITVGNDEHPVTKQETLEKAAELFSSVSKSYKVVWNHTLKVEKITSPEIGEILGPQKYTQVNTDITGGLGMIRALIDGGGDSTAPAAELAVKAIIEEINYARRQVARWIYSEYRAVAEAMGFDRIPKVRFDDMALRDEIQMMTIVQGMIDRRIISYRTGQKKLGFDPDTEVSQLEAERELVEAGILGIVGSPFQQSGGDVQPTQKTPKGTPSEGRPRGRPAKTPEDKDAPDVKGKPTKASSEEKVEIITEALSNLSLEDLESLLAKKKKESGAELENKEIITKPRKPRAKKKKDP